MRAWLSLAVGVLIGQWLAFSGTTSPADVHALGMLALERHDYVEAARIWSRAVSLHPDNPTFHYFRGTALARLGHSTSAVDAFQQALLLEPPEALARLATQGLVELAPPATAGEAIVPIESARGVWIVRASLNGGRPARFLVDTGASVTLISVALAQEARIAAQSGHGTTALHTVAGPATAPSVTIGSIQLGGVEARNVPAVIHDPGLDLDGILGNSFLGRFTVTLDADRQLLHLRPVVH